jgi:hypothetical protein
MDSVRQQAADERPLFFRTMETDLQMLAATPVSDQP